MKKKKILLNLFFFYFSQGYSEEWKTKNKWKVSCGIVDKNLWWSMENLLPSLAKRNLN